MKVRFIFWIFLVSIIFVLGCSLPDETGLQGTISSETKVLTSINTFSSPLPSSSNTNINPVPNPSIHLAAPLSPEEEKKLAFVFASQKTGIQIDKLTIINQQPEVLDKLTLDKIQVYQIFLIAGPPPGVVNVVIDPSTSIPMDYMDYKNMAKKRYDELVGNVSPTVYHKIKDKPDDYLIKVNVYADSLEVATYIESRGFNIYSQRFYDIYVIIGMLSKNIIMELAKRENI
jgi:hypothetical protein